MARLTGKKINCAVFISGAGSNLKSIIKHSKKRKFPIKVKLVISNNPKAKGINFAKKNEIDFKIIRSKKTNVFEKKAYQQLSKRKIRLICLAGFMKILSPKFIKRFKGKILNIHPSLLPKYKGLNTHSRVLKSKEKYSGCTVHFVTAKLDSGKIILQKKVRVKKRDTKFTLQKRILKEEHLLYPKAINYTFKN